MNILIPIETSSRELLYKVYLCRLLALQGFRCYLGSKPQINYLMKCLSGYIYLDKGYHSGESEKLYKVIRKNNGIIVSLDEEGGVDYEDNSTLLGRYARLFFKEVDFVFLWGEKQKELIANNLADISKIEVTGHPRFEMLKPEYHYLYQKKVDKIKEKYGKFILINTNMGFGNNIKGDEFVKENYKERFKKIERIIAFDKIKFELYVHLIVELSKNTDFNIILRPHPEENHKKYLDMVASLDNVKVVYDGSVIPWLLAADQMIHPDCTTAIESLFLGKKSISFLPDSYPTDIVTKLPLNVSTQLYKIEDVIKHITGFNINNEIDDVNSMLFLEKYFSYTKKTTETIVNSLVRIASNIGIGESLEIKYVDVLFLRLKRFYKDLRFRNSLKLQRNKLNGFNFSNIMAICKNISYVKREVDVELKGISKELFCFYIQEKSFKG